jgi:hypothetical protein
MPLRLLLYIARIYEKIIEYCMAQNILYDFYKKRIGGYEYVIIGMEYR